MPTTMAPARAAVLTRPGERRHARDLIDRVGGDGAVQLEIAGQQPTRVPDDLAAIIVRVLRAVADGDTVTIAALPDELTTTQAADQLGVSRPTVMKLIHSGELPAHMVGTHHRVRTADVVAFRRARLARQRAAFDELQALEDQLDEL